VKELPKWKEKLNTYSAATTSFEIDVDILQIFAYATEDWQRESFGIHLASYIQQLVLSLDEYTNSGQDQDARKTFRLAVRRRRISLEADNMVMTCEIDIFDGVLYILFNPKSFAYATAERIITSHYLAEEIDSSDYPL